ncbi:hypothetical protein [Winogradskyella pulchriflava]|uniref:Lipoprotein n=1 Tax=Winogradskyella pulchriflava TaxID=1110688 RepID=A0ABV6QA92_9FLAO
MKNLLKILVIIAILGCSSSKNLINEKPYVYTIENYDGTQTKVKSHTTGKLSNENYEILKSHLLNIIDHDIDFDKKIIINFIDNDPTIYRKGYRVPWDIFSGNIKKNLDKIEECNHFWIINKRVKDLHYYHGKKINWKVDKNNVIRNFFFKNEGLNGGFLILKPNGDYFLKVGEYGKYDVISTYKLF